MSLEKKVVLVTGGARGIGRAIAERLAGVGAFVAIADRGVAECAAIADALPTDALALELDVTVPESVQQAIAAVRHWKGGIDILVNNAGVFDMQPLLDVTVDIYDRLFAVNVKGMFFVMQAVAAEMVATGSGGVIVNMASEAGRKGQAASSIYAATKAAVISLTQSAALALVQHGIRVNAVAPGQVDTPMWAHVDALFAQQHGIAPGEMTRRSVGRIPLARLATPDEIADVALFLASPASRYVVGQTLNVDGGNFLS